MKVLMRRWLLGFSMLFVLAGFYSPKADAQVVVKIGSGHRHYRHHHYHHYYRHR